MVRLFMKTLPLGDITPSITELRRSGFLRSLRFECRERILFLYFTSVLLPCNLKTASKTMLLFPRPSLVDFVKILTQFFAKTFY